MSTPARPFRARALEWLSSAVIAAAFMALVEGAFACLVFPAAASDALGLALLYGDLIAIELAVLAPVALMAVFLEPRCARLVPEPKELLAAFGGSALALAGLFLLERFVRQDHQDFPALTDAIRAVAAATIFIASYGAAKAFLAPLAQRLLSRLPTIGRPCAFGGFVALLTAFAGEALASLVLAPIQLKGVAGLAGIVSAVLMLTGVAAWNLTMGLRGAAAIALLSILAAWPGNPHASYVLGGHCPTVSTWIHAARALADLDGDGAAPGWLGGADCAEGDPRRGPLVPEITGDGIDQDCQGGDARSQATSRVHRNPSMPRCPGLPAKPSVLLITVDALRADAISPRATPEIHRFATASIRFTRAYAPGTRTLSSIPSILTGRPVADLGGPSLGYLDTPQGLTLAERLRDTGRHTAAFVHFILLPKIQRGFQDMNAHHFDELTGKHDLLAARMTNGIETVLERIGDARSFFWAHYGDAHAPYKGERGLAGRYEFGVSYVDAHVGRLLNYLGNTGRLDQTIVVVTADHGESLGAHGVQGHGPFPYQDTTHVPLFVWIPGCAPRAIDVPTSLSALAPTLGELAAVDVPGRKLPIDGEHDGWPAVTDAPWLGFYRRSIVGKRYSLVVDLQTHGEMLFDLSDDRGETRNVARARPDALEEMHAAYQRWLDTPGAR